MCVSCTGVEKTSRIESLRWSLSMACSGTTPSSVSPPPPGPPERSALLTPSPSPENTLTMPGCRVVLELPPVFAHAVAATEMPPAEQLRELPSLEPLDEHVGDEAVKFQIVVAAEAGMATAPASSAINPRARVCERILVYRSVIYSSAFGESPR